MFIGAETVVLPGVHIGNNVVIGANSTVTHDIPDNSVAFGSPARVYLSLDQYVEKERKRMSESPQYDKRYTLGGNITKELKVGQKEDLKKGIGYIV